jgi:hypothetical protein
VWLARGAVVRVVRSAYGLGWVGIREVRLYARALSAHNRIGRGPTV